MDEKINSSFSDYKIDFQPASSYLTGDLVQINVPYAASQANNFSTQVDEMDLSLTSDVESIYDLKTSWGETAKKFLEEIRAFNNAEIERLQNENDSLEKKYQEFLATNPQDVEQIALAQMAETYAANTTLANEGISSELYAANAGIANTSTVPYAAGLSGVTKEGIIKELNFQYVATHLDEFESFMGMSLDEYNQKIAENEYNILGLKANDYKLRQEAKEAPFKELISTEEFQIYALSYNGGSEQSRNYLENRNLENYLDDDQLMMFSYLYDTMGFAAANEYLKAIEDKINQAKGLAEAEVFLSKIIDEEGNVDVGALEYTLLTSGQGILNGIETFGEGFENLFDVTSDGVITDNQYAQQYILQGLSELQEKGQLPAYLDDTYQISSSIGNMLPGSVISILTGGTVGNVLMGMSAAGNAKNEALTTMSDNRGLAYSYGILAGFSEAFLGEKLGNIPGLNESAKFSIKGLLSEGVEELNQTFVDAGLKAVIYGEIPDLGDLTEEGLKSFLYGCITSGIMTGSQAGISFTINGAKHTYNSLNELINAYNDGKIVDVDSKSVNNNPSTSNTSDINIRNKIKRYNELMEIMASEDYKKWDGVGKYVNNIDADTSNYFMKISNELACLRNEFIPLAIARGVSINDFIESFNVGDAANVPNQNRSVTSNSANKFDITRDILEIIEAHNKKHGVGDAEKRLKLFIDPKSAHYGNYAMISNNGGARNIFMKYTPAQIAAGLSSLGYYIGNVPVDNSVFLGYSFNELSAWYDSNSSVTYGVDQGAIEDLCVYIWQGKQYTYRQTRDIVNNAVKEGKSIPNFSKQGTNEYFRLKYKLKNMGFSYGDASIILSSINDAGACSYASLVNEIFFSFRNNIKLFEKTFGYSYYKNGDRNNGVNDTELLLDLYLFANDVNNGGSFIVGNKLINKGNTIDVFGRRILDAENQTYMSSSLGRNDSVIDRFLKSKDLDFGYSSSTVIRNNNNRYYFNDYQFEVLKKRLNDYISKGYTLSMDYFYNPRYNDTIIRMNNIDGRRNSCTTASWKEGGGHSVAITGMTNKGFIISSWGAKFVIPFDDLKNGGRFQINISNINLK